MSRHHIPGGIVQLTEELRVGAAGVMEIAFKGRQKCVEIIPGLYREAVTRGVNGEISSPLCRLAWWIVALRLAGSLSAAQLLVDFLQDLVDRLSSDISIDVRDASLAEQRAEGEENPLQLEYAQAGELERARLRPQLIERIRRERAASGVWLQALVAEETAAQRNAKAA